MCKDKDVKISYDLGILKDNSLYTKDSLRKKFITSYNFKDFPVNNVVLKDSSIQVKINNTEFGRRFKTMIKQSFEYGNTNFAGKYILNYWGCGSPCALGIIIDVENGNIVELPVSSAGYKYEIKSRMLIVNPPDSLNFYYDSFIYQPEIFVLDTINRMFIEKK